MALNHDLVRHAGALHARRGIVIDREKEKENIKQYFAELGIDEKSILESLEAMAPDCMGVAKGVWWMTMIRPTKLCVLADRIVYIRRFLWFRQLFRFERAVMIRHIREVEIDLYLFSATLTFRTHRSVDVFQVKKLYKKHSRRLDRIIQALIHEELNHGSVPSGDDFT